MKMLLFCVANVLFLPRFSAGFVPRPVFHPPSLSSSSSWSPSLRRESALGATSGLDYKTSLQLLGNFLSVTPDWKKEDAGYSGGVYQVHDFNKESPQDIIPALYKDIATRVSDKNFKALSNLTDWSKYAKKELPESYKNPVETSVWAQAANTSAIDVFDLPPNLDMDMVMRGLSTCAFMAPEGGAGISASISLLYAAKKSQDAKLIANLDKVCSAVNSCDRPSNPLADVSRWVTKDIDEKVLGARIDTVKSRIKKLNDIVNRHVYSLGEIQNDEKLRDEILNNNMVFKKIGIPLKTSAFLKKSTVLKGSEAMQMEGLGPNLRELYKLTEWIEIVKGTPVESKYDTVECNLAEGNPTFSLATFSLFVSAGADLVKASVIYILLSLLPDEAFRPGWNGDDDDGMPFNRTKALVKSFHAKDSDGREAYDTLVLLNEMLDPSESFMKRFDDARVIWAKVYERLTAVKFEQGLPAYRNKRWYMEETKTIKRMFESDDIIFADEVLDLVSSPVKLLTRPDQWPTFISELGDIKDLIFSKSTDPDVDLKKIFKEECKGGQVALEDERVAEPALERFNNNFHTLATLRVWFKPHKYHFPGVPKKWKDLKKWLKGKKRLPTVKDAVTNLVREVMDGRYKHNKNPTYIPKKSPYKFPLELKDSSHLAEQKAYTDVFWKLPEHSSKDFTNRKQFLESEEGRDTIGWLGIVLANYLKAYNIMVDINSDMNTFALSWVAMKDIESQHASTTALLTEIQNAVKKEKEKEKETVEV